MQSQSVPEPKQRMEVPVWSGRTRGGYFGNWFFIQLIRVGGLRLAYVWLHFVAVYFVLAAPGAYRSSVGYLRRVLGPQPFWKWPVLVYRHFCSLGVTLLDRLALIMGRSRLECRIEGETDFKAVLDQGKGVLLLGAHVGSWEIGGQLLSRLGKPVNLVVLEKEAARVRDLFDRVLEGKQFRLLTTDEHPLRSIPIIAALRRGEIVALHGDRSFGGADLKVSFLGDPARFPVGAYQLAAFSGAPIFQGFAVRERMGEYRLFTFPPKYVSGEMRRAPLEAWRAHVAEYAANLESVVRRYPFQWYNFYPFWES